MPAHIHTRYQSHVDVIEESIYENDQIVNFATTAADDFDIPDDEDEGNCEDMWDTYSPDKKDLKDRQRANMIKSKT